MSNKNSIFKTVALIGNPNVGKSTIFNIITGMNQHTGNWPGKTVNIAKGSYTFNNKTYQLIDLPGTYSLNTLSSEEEVARDYILFKQPDVTVVICDATCLERSLNIALQVIATIKNVIICINLIDEANKKQIQIDVVKLSNILHVPVIAVSARQKQGINNLLTEIDLMCQQSTKKLGKIQYDKAIENIISQLSKHIETKNINKEIVALKLLNNDIDFINNLALNNEITTENLNKLNSEVQKSKDILISEYSNSISLQDIISSQFTKISEEISKKCIHKNNQNNKKYKHLDDFLTNKWTGLPSIILLLCMVFWITIAGANAPSEFLSTNLFKIQDILSDFFQYIQVPDWIEGILIQGMFKTLAWVVSVMLPPMAIFFPIFTLLEDFGYLPRVAFHLDCAFKKAGACGKQALTTCMGFGCNAAGIIGCRIIDSPRERLIAILTNNFTPCNGRFPTLIALITMFCLNCDSNSLLNSLICAIYLSGIIILGLIMTFIVSKILSKTILKGFPSFFTLELPPYRKPQFGKVIIRSIFDRTLFVLGRAIIVAAPAGIILWILSNVIISDISILNHISNFLDPFAKLFGLDGVILIAFILGFPANEIVIPIIIMAYLCKGSLVEYENLTELKTLFVNNGWTWLTALCTSLFCLMHWPCSTTCLTIKKECKSFKWTVISFIIPTICGFTICFIVANFCRLLHLI